MKWGAGSDIAWSGEQDHFTVDSQVQPAVSSHCLLSQRRVLLLPQQSQSRVSPQRRAAVCCTMEIQCRRGLRPHASRPTFGRCRPAPLWATTCLGRRQLHGGFAPGKVIVPPNCAITERQGQFCGRPVGLCPRQLQQGSLHGMFRFYCVVELPNNSVAPNVRSRTAWTQSCCKK